MSRRVAREKALQTLFQVDLVGADPDTAIADLLEQSALNTAAGQFARQLVSGTLAHLAECDRFIAEFSRQWELNRLANVDRNILRMAIYEMNYIEGIPHNVTINEAIELAKAFSGEQSAKYINGLLDAVRKQQFDG